MSGQESSSGRGLPYLSPEAKRQAIWWTVAAVSAPIAGAAVWWLSETAINRLAPPEVRWQSIVHACMHSKWLLAPVEKPKRATDWHGGSMQYHYRPGTVSEYISELLAKHAKSRRSALLCSASNPHMILPRSIAWVK